MIYSNSQLAFYIAKQVNEVHDKVVYITKVINETFNGVTQAFAFESFLDKTDIIMVGDPRETPFEVMVLISQPDVGEKYEENLILSYGDKEKLYLRLGKPVSTLDIMEWLLFHFDIHTVWDLYTGE